MREQRQVNGHDAANSPRSNIEVIALMSKTIVDMPVDVSQNRLAGQQVCQRTAADVFTRIDTVDESVGG